MRPSLFFLATDAGQVLITQFPSIKGGSPQLNLIVVPPFCEEMNKSRKMLATFARRASSKNIKVNLIDLSGTGDSEGDFSCVTLGDWQQNIVTLYEELQRQDPGTPITVLGLRTGALLALGCCINKMINPFGLLLWQPVLNGQQFINQFMRLRLAAEMVSNESKYGMNDLLDELTLNGYVEIGGYSVSKTLIDQIGGTNHVTLDSLPKGLNVGWVEVGHPPKQDLLPISQKVVAKWRQRSDVFAQFVVGASFWQTQEVTLAENLISCSIDYLLGRLDD